jgi:hypothetical protein
MTAVRKSEAQKCGRSQQKEVGGYRARFNLAPKKYY